MGIVLHEPSVSLTDFGLALECGIFIALATTSRPTETRLPTVLCGARRCRLSWVCAAWFPVRQDFPLASSGLDGIAIVHRRGDLRYNFNRCNPVHQTAAYPLDYARLMPGVG